MAIFGKNNLYLNIFLILITLSIISISPQNTTNSTDTINSTEVADTTNLTTDVADTSNSTNVTDTTNSTELSDTSTSTTDVTDTTNSTETTDSNDTSNGNSTTYPVYRDTSSGLSGGAIAAIIVPCALALIGVGLAAALCKSAPEAISPITPNVIPPTIDSSMSKFNTQPITAVNNLQEITEVSPPVKNVEVIQPTPVVQQHPIYPISKEPPTIPQDNRVFQPLYPSQNAQAINISQSSPQVSQVIPKQEIVASQNQLNPGQVVQGINTSQATNQSQVLPVKILPIVD